MSKVIIGKYALESLTSGMYADSFVVYREYIQNAVDSIDNAYQNGCLLIGQEQVLVTLNPFEKSIEFSDNGLGIAASEAERTLTGIGNSKKDLTSTRGFRGIGRLAALSLCKKLTFETSYPGERLASRLTIDAFKLNELLTSKNASHDISADEVMESVCLFEQFKVSSKNHYFKVIMDGLDIGSDLLKLPLVKDYLEQVAPVPFDTNKFAWGNEIIRRVQKCGYTIPQYKIQIRSAAETLEVLKPYQDRFLVDKARNLYDTIQDVVIYEIYDAENKIMAIVWSATTNYVGTVVDKAIKGLRTRKGNILIGDGQTLNTAFKDARFNGWIIGEVYVLDLRLLPNARRDNFEKTPSYLLFSEKMTAFASDIIKQIRATSLKRNSNLEAVINKTESISEATISSLEKPRLSPQEKGNISQRLNITKKEVVNTDTNQALEGLFQDIAFEQLDMLIGKVQGATAYKAINLMSSLSKTEKKILERVFHIIRTQLSESDTQKVADAILAEFAISK